MTTEPTASPTIVYAPAAPGRSVMAVFSVLTAFFVSPLGLALGILARRNIKQTGRKGANWAMTGIVLSSAILAFDILVAHKLPLPLP